MLIFRPGALPQNFQTRKLGEIIVFYAVNSKAKLIKNIITAKFAVKATLKNFHHEMPDLVNLKC